MTDKIEQYIEQRMMPKKSSQDSFHYSVIVEYNFLRYILVFIGQNILFNLKVLEWGGTVKFGIYVVRISGVTVGCFDEPEVKTRNEWNSNTAA